MCRWNAPLAHRRRCSTRGPAPASTLHEDRTGDPARLTSPILELWWARCAGSGFCGPPRVLDFPRAGRRAGVPVERSSEVISRDLACRGCPLTVLRVVARSCGVPAPGAPRLPRICPVPASWVRSWGFSARQAPQLHKISPAPTSRMRSCGFSARHTPQLHKITALTGAGGPRRLDALLAATPSACSGRPARARPPAAGHRSWRARLHRGGWGLLLSRGPRSGFRRLLRGDSGVVQGSPTSRPTTTPRSAHELPGCASGAFQWNMSAVIGAVLSAWCSTGIPALCRSSTDRRSRADDAASLASPPLRGDLVESRRVERRKSPCSRARHRRRRDLVESR
jgi:hypothetical protein